MNKERYWVTVASRDHTQRGVNDSFIQVCHGKKSPLERMKKGDHMVVYSPKLTFEGTEKCQAFTAIGKVEDDVIYPCQMTETFRPFRRNIKFTVCRDAPIQPLISELEFIRNKKSWGYPFRFGFFEIQQSDFDKIASRMLKHEVI